MQVSPDADPYKANRGARAPAGALVPRRTRTRDLGHVVVPLLEAQAREAQRRLPAPPVLLGQLRPASQPTPAKSPPPPPPPPPRFAHQGTALSDGQLRKTCPCPLRRYSTIQPQPKTVPNPKKKDGAPRKHSPRPSTDRDLYAAQAGARAQGRSVTAVQS